MLMLWLPMLSGAIHGKELPVEIVRGVDDHHQPGWVEAEIVDVEGTIREVHDAPNQRVKKTLSRVQLQF